MPRRSNEGSPKASQGSQEAERAAYCSVCEQLGYRSVTQQMLPFHDKIIGAT
jgi:hypothetical protein